MDAERSLRSGESSGRWLWSASSVSILAGLLLALPGCVGAEHREVRAARRAFQQCVEEHPDSDAACEALRERSLRAQERYEENSRRAWGCDPAQPECPTPR